MPGLTAPKTVLKGAVHKVKQFCGVKYLLLKDPVQLACGDLLYKYCADDVIEEDIGCPHCDKLLRCNCNDGAIMEMLDVLACDPNSEAVCNLEWKLEFLESLFGFLRRELLRERLREFLLRQEALRQEKSLESNTSTPLDARWLEFQSLLLLAYGDVERNPGPMTRDELEKVANDVLSEDDYFEVFTSVSTLCAKWHDFCLALGLLPSLLASIRKDHTGDSSGCLREGLISWLQQSYKKEKHGLPSWRRLVEAVDHPAGGDNHALASKIAEEHEQPEVLPPKKGSVSAPIPAAVCSDPKKSQAMSTAFANMYRAISRLLPRSVKVVELKEFLRCFCHPQSPRQLCVDPRVYEGATSTKDILKKLCPEYINPAELFVLEGIVETFGSRQCKKLLRDFQDKFY